MVKVSVENEHTSRDTEEKIYTNVLAHLDSLS